MSVFDYLVPIAVGAVAIVLALGLINMLRGGNSNTSQKLMRALVIGLVAGGIFTTTEVPLTIVLFGVSTTMIGSEPGRKQG